LDPGPQLDFPSPGAALLAVEVEILGGNGVRVEQAVGAACTGARVAGPADGAVDDEMADMDVLRRELAGEALRQAAPADLADGEGDRARIAFDARRGAGEEDRAMAARQHGACGGLRHQEPA